MLNPTYAERRSKVRNLEIGWNQQMMFIISSSIAFAVQVKETSLRRPHSARLTSTPLPHTGDTGEIVSSSLEVLSLRP